LQRLSGPGWSPLAAAVFTAAFFMLLTVKFYVTALTCGVLAIALILVWSWDNDPRPLGDVDIGRGVVIPSYASGPVSHAWWAVVIFTLVAGSLYLAYVFSYLYIWTVAPQGWATAANAGAAWMWPTLSGSLLILSAAAVAMASRVLGRSSIGFIALVLVGVGALSAALAIEIYGHWQSGLRPDASAYGALVYLASLLQFEIVAAVVIIGVTFEVLMLMSYYAIGQGLLGLALVHGFPRTVS
jgi:cytochrome c oxidase subunit I+III